MSRIALLGSAGLARTRLVVALAVLGPLLWFFGVVLFGGQMFVYRDSAHYYYPLFERTRTEWSAGTTPLWNPQENCGVPLLADNTAGLLYPGKLFFALPLEFPACYKLYVMTHFLLAIGAAFALARHWKASSLAAAVCGLSYAFGGNVLIQYSNVVFLVGAAWLPLAILAADKMLRQRRVIWAFVLGAILALMVLGGDPQTAYHAGLLSAMYALVLWRAERRRQKSEGSLDDEEAALPSGRFFHRLLSHRMTLLSLAAVSSTMLAAVQVLPSMQWTRHSDRAAFDQPRSLYEIPALLAHQQNEKGANKKTRIASGLLGTPKAGTHHRHIYLFSVGPWRLPELVWPNFSGRSFPTNRRWTNVIPAEGQAWTPSLYMGLLPLLLAVGSFRLRGGATAEQRWMSWAILLGLLGSLGWYGLGWLLHEIRSGFQGAAADEALLGQPVGGLYWLMVTVLPGYAYFRFPAKLMVVAALGASVLAAHGWDRAFSGQSIKLRRAVLVLGSLSLVGVIISLAVRPFWKTWLQDVAADNYFGPLDAAGSANDLLLGMLHATLLCGALWWVLGRLGRDKNARWAAVALLITALDLALANGWMVASAPQEIWQQPPQMAKRILAEEGKANTSSTEPFRVFRSTRPNWQPSNWPRVSSPQRQTEGLQWKRDTLFPKYHLQTELSLCESAGSMNHYEYLAFLDVARQGGAGRSVLDTISARYMVLPEDFTSSAMRRVEVGNVENTSLWHNPRAFPRAWIVHDLETLPSLKRSSPTKIRRRTERVLFAHGKFRDFKSQAVIETDSNFPPVTLGLRTSRVSSTSESCRIAIDQPNRVALDVVLTSPGLVVLNDLYYPGWVAQAAGDFQKMMQSVPTFRTNRIMRGVYLPAGKYRIDYRYQPTCFYVGAVISTLGWVLVAVCMIVWWRARGKRDSEKTAGKPAR